MNLFRVRVFRINSFAPGKGHLTIVGSPTSNFNQGNSLLHPSYGLNRYYSGGLWLGTYFGGDREQIVLTIQPRRIFAMLLQKAAPRLEGIRRMARTLQIDLGEDHLKPSATLIYDK